MPICVGGGPFSCMKVGPRPTPSTLVHMTSVVKCFPNVTSLYTSVVVPIPIKIIKKALQHSYKVKIINPHRKSDVIIRHLNHFSSRMRLKLNEEFGGIVPNNLSFNVGYFEGQQHTKIWLVSRADFATMYSRYPKGEITLWCEGNSTEEEDCGSKKR